MRGRSRGQRRCVPSGSPRTGQGQSFVLLQHWLIALSLSVSPLVLLSQTCHLAPSGAGTPVGHFLSPLASELILASPSLIFLHCLSPLSRPQLSPPGAVSCSSDCMSPGTAPLMAVVLAGGHPRTSPPALPCAPSLAGPVLLDPGQAPAWGRCALFVLEVPTVPHCLAVASNPWLPGGQSGFCAGGKGASGSELKKAEQSHLHGWERLAWL